MYRIIGMIGMVVIASPFLFGYYASDLLGLWYSVLVGFGLVLLSVEALRRERFEREQQFTGSRWGKVCPVVVRVEDYGRSARRSYAARSSTRDESIY